MIILQTIKPYGKPVNHDITLHCEAGNSLALLGGGNVFTGEIKINAKTAAWPLDFTVIPQMPALSCKIYAKGQVDDFGEKAVDTIHGRIVNVDLDVETDGKPGITDGDEHKEENPGGYACVCTNNLTPINLTIQPAGLSGKVTLSTTDGGGRIRIWADAKRKTEVILPKTWNASATIPATLYVEGIAPSAAVRDVELRLEYDENPPGQNNPLFKCEDRVRLTVFSVEFQENAPCAGCDPTLNPPWLMVPLPAGGNNKANAEITPAAAAANIDFESAAVAKATVAPATASGSPEILTVASVAKGDTEVRAKVDAAECAIMGISVKDKLTKTIVIHAITEDNDDVQAIPVGQGKPNVVAITAGANTTLDSTPSGDDQVAGTTITTGADGICTTTAVSDDVQIIAVGKGKANQNCVTAGTNAKRDTKISGDDTVVGENVTTGSDGICDTVANATDLPAASVPTAAGLQAYLNDTIWGKQANVFFTVTRTDHVLNFDLDLDGMLDDPYATPSGGNKVPQEWDEVNVVRGVKDATKDFNIYYVGSYEYPIGLTVGEEVFTQGSSPGGNSVENHTAHEVGHLLGRSGESNAPKDVMYKSGLPSNPCRVLKLDWDAVNP